jgi:hypothetical protein
MEKKDVAIVEIFPTICGTPLAHVKILFVFIPNVDECVKHSSKG